MQGLSLDLPELIGLKDFRTDTEKYIKALSKGKSFTVLRRSKPIFRLEPYAGEWGIDFRTPESPDGVSADEFILAAEKVLKNKNG
jgi:antitoxin (DNA-binding transcriptional repressor) of toxin-antitoxin stability system